MAGLAWSQEKCGQCATCELSLKSMTLGNRFLQILHDDSLLLIANDLLQRSRFKDLVLCADIFFSSLFFIVVNNSTLIHYQCTRSWRIHRGPWVGVQEQKDRPYLGVNKPAVVKRDVEKVEHNAFWGVLKHSHACELHVYVQTRLQLVQHCHGVTHVLEKKKKKEQELIKISKSRYIN